MGTACICYKQQKGGQLIQPLQQQHIQMQGVGQQRDRFKDIFNEDQVLSELDLNVINNELSRYLIEFQLKNGAITNRFTQRLLPSLQPTQELQHFEQQIQKPYEGKQVEHIKSTIEQSRKENELYLPLQNQNADSLLEPSDSDHELGNQNKSCLLSLSSRILHQSLFTDRNYQKTHFYNVYNKIGETQLEKWCDNNRLTYQYQLDQVQQLKNKQIDSKFITCLRSLHHHWETHFIHLLTYCQTGLKIYVNGDQKIYPISYESHFQLANIYDQLITKVQDLDLAHLIYLLVGWIPQHISLNDVKNYRSILQRLQANISEANTLINFTRDTQFGQQYATLSRIDLKNQIIYLFSNNHTTTIPTILLQYSNPRTNEIGIAFNNFIELYDLIDLNWNPFIYEYSMSCQGILNRENRLKTFILVIPPSSQDLQIRLFLQMHQDIASIKASPAIISLYEYDGLSEGGEGQPIRTIEANQFIYSDVFIFQYCKQKSQYLLTIKMVQQQQPLEDDIYFTMTLYSFAQMKFKQLQKKPCLAETALVTHISQQNMGYGINSPYFNKNLQFSVQVQTGSSLQMNVQASRDLIYQICLIPDPQRQQNLTKLKLQDIINNSEISGEKRGKESFIIKTICTHYLLMINAYSQAKQDITVGLKLYGKSKANSEHILSLQQIQANYQPIFMHEVKWLPTHSGPRKRLKSNSSNSYQPLSTFSQFFKNPVIDKKLIKGTYQFFIKSQTFRQYFDSVENYHDKSGCEPPPLSMAIFLSSEDKKLYKIMADDAFYVPFGVGFWTQSMDLEEGTYRFVFPKMDKGFSKGTFGIIKN